jgi:DNA-binding transcriptional LysR family regulator
MMTWPVIHWASSPARKVAAKAISSGWAGLCDLLALQFSPELESAEVVSLLGEWSLPAMDLWVIYPSGRLTSTKARVFVNWLEQIIT